MAHEPTQHPFPVAPGGLRQTGYRTLRGALGTDVRQPDLGGAPNVVSIAGFGTAGAMIVSQGSAADKSQGLVSIRCGPSPGASGTVVLNFGAPVSAGAYWAAADWASCTLSAAGNNLTITWTANRTLLPFEVLTLAYQWLISS